MSDTRTYTITRLPATDSQDSSAICWDHIPSLPIDNQQWTAPVDIRAFAKICYDENALHIRLYAQEKDIRAEETSIIGMPCEDSCLEFFFSPIEGDLRYFNIEFNPNCCMYLGIGGAAVSDLVRLLPEGKENPFHAKSEKTADGWYITYSIPYTFIRHFFPAFEAKPGKSIRANCYKCGDLTVNEHYFSWNAINWETPRFHKPDDFGIMQFGV